MATSITTSDHIARNTAAHDRIADTYDAGHQEIFNEHEQARLRRALAEAVSHVTSTAAAPAALDMGCGSGNLTRHLLELGCAVTAADVSPRFLRLVEQRFAGARLLTSQLNGADLSQFADDSFDVVATYSVLHHIPDYLAAVREMARICRPGGVIYIDHEALEQTYRPDPEYLTFRKRVARPDRGKWLRPINYYGKVRRLFEPRFTNEGDIHVWPDDHIEWTRIRSTLGDAVETVMDHSYLLYSGRYRKDVYAEYEGRLVDTRLMAFRKR